MLVDQELFRGLFLGIFSIPFYLIFIFFIFLCVRLSDC